MPSDKRADPISGLAADQTQLHRDLRLSSECHVISLVPVLVSSQAVTNYIQYTMKRSLVFLLEVRKSPIDHRRTSAAHTYIFSNLKEFGR
jgi:hypothetical protein